MPRRAFPAAGEKDAAAVLCEPPCQPPRQRRARPHRRNGAAALGSRPPRREPATGDRRRRPVTGIGQGPLQGAHDQAADEPDVAKAGLPSSSDGR